MIIEITIFSVLLLISLFWSRLVKNWFYYSKNKKKWLIGGIILCRERLRFAFEVVGILLIVIKLISTGPGQEEYNRMLAEATLSSIHATSELYRTINPNIPYSFPEIFDTSNLEKTRDRVPVDKEKVFEEVNKYIRRASKFIGDYYGYVVPECEINGRIVRIVSPALDSEIVGIEQSRLTYKKNICRNAELNPGIMKEIIRKTVFEARIDLIGLLFILFAIFIKYQELRFSERDRNLKPPKEWYWNLKNIK